MFTGLVQEVGEIRRLEPRGGDVRLEIGFRSLDAARLGLGASICVDGVCLTVAALDGSTLRGGCLRRNPARHDAGRQARRARASISSRRCAPATASAGTGSPGTSTASPKSLHTARDARSLAVTLAAPAAAGALHRAQGLGDPGRGESHGQRGRWREFLHQPHSAHARGDDPGSARARRARQSRNRPAGALRRAPELDASSPRHETTQFHRGNPRRHRRRAHGRHHGRRRSRERRRPHHGGAERAAPRTSTSWRASGAASSASRSPPSAAGNCACR